MWLPWKVQEIWILKNINFDLRGLLVGGGVRRTYARKIPIEFMYMDYLFFCPSVLDNEKKNKGVRCHKAKKYILGTPSILLSSILMLKQLILITGPLVPFSIPIIIILMFPFQVPVPVFLYISRSKLKIWFLQMLHF